MTLAVQIAQLVACIGFIVLVPVIILALYRLDKCTERLLHVVEKFRAECTPMVRKLDATAERLQLLSAMAQDQWHEVEKIVLTARKWAQRADRLMEEVGSVVEPPVFGVSRRINFMRIGLKAFFRTLLSNYQHHQEKAKDIYEPR